MTNIVNLDAYFEEVDLLKQQINKQVSYITENIQHFNCDPNVKKFLQLATNNCILLCKGNIQRLHELIHSEKLNLQNLKVGSKIDVQTFFNHTKCQLIEDLDDNKHLLLIYYTSTASPSTKLAIFYNDEHVVTNIQIKLS